MPYPAALRSDEGGDLIRNKEGRIDEVMATIYDELTKMANRTHGNSKINIFSVKIWDCKVRAMDCEIPIKVPKNKEDVTIIKASQINKPKT